MSIFWLRFTFDLVMGGLPGRKRHRAAPTTHSPVREPDQAKSLSYSATHGTTNARFEWEVEWNVRNVLNAPSFSHSELVASIPEADVEQQTDDGK